MHSSGHRANILSRDFRELGVGFSAGTPSGGRDPGGIYTTDFGLASADGRARVQGRRRWVL